MAAPRRIHLIASANPLGKDVQRLGFADSGGLLSFIRELLPSQYRLTYTRKVLDAEELPLRGGRRDDDARVRDLQNALNDPDTLAIVALSGGGYFTRILPRLSFDALQRRKSPLWALGFSEITSLVNLVASYRMGRGVYWLCPNYLAWKLKPPENARNAYGEFWRGLPDALQHNGYFKMPAFQTGDVRIEAERVSGRVENGSVQLIGGCLSVLAPLLGGEIARRLRPDGRWLAMEDVNEAPYRVDRCLAALKIAGWFERLAGIIVGDFHTQDELQTDAVIELLRFHVPRERQIPILKSASFGHVWPMAPLQIGLSLKLTTRGRRVVIVAPDNSQR